MDKTIPKLIMLTWKETMKTLVDFINSLFQFSPWKIVLGIVLFIGTGFLQGFSLLLLQPLLAFTDLSSSLTSSKNTIINHVFQSINFHGSLIQVLLIYVSIITIIATLNFIQTKFMSYLNQAYEYDLQQKLYKAFISTSWPSIVKMKRSDLNQLLTNEIGSVSYGIHILINLTATLIITSIYLGTAFLLSWKLTLVAITCGLLLYIAFHYQSQLAKKLGQKNYLTVRELYSSINDHFVGAKLAKAYCLENRLTNHFQKITRDLMKYNLQFVTTQAINHFFYLTSGAVVFSIIFYFSVSHYHIPVITLFILLIIFARLIAQLSSFQQNYQSLMHVLPSYEAIQKMFDCFETTDKTETCEISDRLPLKNNIVFKDVSFSYDPTSNDNILNRVNLTIPINKVTAIIGPSGAGKSTLIDMLIGLLTPTSGHILVDNKILDRKRIKAWRNCIAYVPQDDTLLNDTIRSNLTWVTNEVSDSDITQSLKMANIYDFVQALPHQLETIVGDDGVCLSGGEKQRIMLARALLRKPALLILDEATCSLDVTNEDNIFETLRQLRNQLTLVIVSHRTSSLHWVDQMLIVENGTTTISNQYNRQTHLDSEDAK